MSLAIYTPADDHRWEVGEDQCDVAAVRDPVGSVWIGCG